VVQTVSAGLVEAFRIPEGTDVLVEQANQPGAGLQHPGGQLIGLRKRDRAVGWDLGEWTMTEAVPAAPEEREGLHGRNLASNGEGS